MTLFDDYDKLPKIESIACMWEDKEGVKYHGMIGIYSGPGFQYNLDFDVNLRSLFPVITSEPLTVIKQTDLYFTDCETLEEIDFEDYTTFQLAGILIGGAKSMLEGNYEFIGNKKYSQVKTQITKTKSIDKLLIKKSGGKK
jgi:hypothetical protein